MFLIQHFINVWKFLLTYADTSHISLLYNSTDVTQAFLISSVGNDASNSLNVANNSLEISTVIFTYVAFVFYTYPSLQDHYICFTCFYKDEITKICHLRTLNCLRLPIDSIWLFCLQRFLHHLGQINDEKK